MTIQSDFGPQKGPTSLGRILAQNKAVLKEYSLIQWAYKEIQELGEKHNIKDIFQDAKLLPILLIMKLKILPGRTGNDAIDSDGNEYEIKTTTTGKLFSTNHHLNTNILEKYKKVKWLFGVYKKAELKKLYIMEPNELFPYFEKWEKELEYKEHLNNPKISLKYVKHNGNEVDLENFE